MNKNKKSNTTTWSHTGTIGDIWASFPALRQYWKLSGKKVILLLKANIPAIYHDSWVQHPTQLEDGSQVMLNDKMVEMMIPLIKAQSFIHDCKKWDGEKIDFPLEAIRTNFVNMPHHNLAKWYFFIYPDIWCDLSKKWMEIPDTDKDFGTKDKLIVARTERYHNPNINYKFLKQYQERLMFSGTELEHVIFTTRFGLKIPRLIIKDFLELAQAFKQSKGLLSNQTQAFQICEGAKLPRIVELFLHAPNVEAVGENGYEFYAQGALELYTKILLGIAKLPIPKKESAALVRL